jgi:hypothetical protein
MVPLCRKVCLVPRAFSTRVVPIKSATGSLWCGEANRGMKAIDMAFHIAHQDEGCIPADLRLDPRWQSRGGLVRRTRYSGCLVTTEGVGKGSSPAVLEPLPWRHGLRKKCSKRSTRTRARTPWCRSYPGRSPLRADTTHSGQRLHIS